MERFLLAFCLSFFLLFPTLSSIQISEVMPHSNNPLECEWVELYNPSNLTIFFNGSIGDLQSKDEIAFNLTPNSYFLIIDDDCNISDIPSNLSFLILPAIGNGLRDKKDCIFLNSPETNESFCWNRSIKKKGYSFCRINNTWYENCTPTPGRENKLKPKNFLSIEVNLDKVIVNLSYDNLFKIRKFYDLKNCTLVRINYTIFDYYLSRTFNYSIIIDCVKNLKYAGTGFFKPEREGVFKICGEIVFPADEDKSDNRACKNVTAIKVFEIKEKPSVLSFGSLGFVKGILYKKGLEALFNKNISRIKLLVYSPRGQGSYIVRNFDDSVIYSVEGCNSEFAVTLSNLPNKTYLSIPFFITKNCDNSKREGTYQIKVRVFDFENKPCNKSEHYDIAEFQVKIQGINKDLCPKEKIVYRTKKSKEAKKKIEISIENQTIQYPYIFSEIKIKNNEKKEISGLLYSYLFKGRKCFSGDWRENQIFISLPPKSSIKIRLNNTISEKAKAGTYKFRVRFLAGNKKYDFTKDIYLSIPEEKESKKPKTPNFIFKKEQWNFSIEIRNCTYCRISGNFNSSILDLYFYSNRTLLKREYFNLPIQKKNAKPEIKNYNLTATKKELKDKLPSSKIVAPSFFSPFLKILSFFEYLIKSSIRRI
mgnify:CR=1 FL=1